LIINTCFAFFVVDDFLEVIKEEGALTMNQQKFLVNFGLHDEETGWEILNDEVMGGISRSTMIITPDKTAVFQGELSLKNYGGFASVRTLPRDFKVDGCDGLILHVKGDGQRYRLRLRTDDLYDGMAYQAVFSTEPGKWMTVNLPFSTFVPVFRGRIVPGAPPLKPGNIRRIGFMIADKQEGKFRLEIEWVKAFSEN
jgi:monofunctional biosynthetic peptidoglycan transglycosylase